MAQDARDDVYIVETLKKQGFSEDLISKAISNTNSRKLEDIVDCIEDIQQSDGGNYREFRDKKQLEDEIRLRREENQRNKVYLEQLRERIREDRLEREQTSRPAADPQIVRSEVITDFGECTIKVRCDGKVHILHFKRKSTTSDLLKVVREKLGLKSFRLFLVNPPAEVIESEVTLEEIGFVPTGMVIVQK